MLVGAALNDPKKRAAFAATLETLVRGQPEPAPPASAPPPQPAATQDTTAPPPAEGIAIQLAPNSLGAEVLLTASSFLNQVANQVPRALDAVQSLPPPSLQSPTPRQQWPSLNPRASPTV